MQNGKTRSGDGIIFQFRPFVEVHLLGVDLHKAIDGIEVPDCVVAFRLDCQRASALAVNADVGFAVEGIRIDQHRTRGGQFCAIHSSFTLSARPAGKADSKYTDAVQFVLNIQFSSVYCVAEKRRIVGIL